MRIATAKGIVRAAAVVAWGAAGLVLPPGCKKEPPPPPPAPATQAATAPAPKPPTTQYVDVIRASYPKFPATQPLGVPVDLMDAGHFVLPDDIHLGARGDLWIARPDAGPLEETLKRAVDEDVHVVTEPVELVQWAADEETGKWFPRLAVRTAGSSPPAATTTTAPSLQDASPTTAAPVAAATATTAPSLQGAVPLTAAPVAAAATTAPSLETVSPATAATTGPAAGTGLASSRDASSRNGAPPQPTTAPAPSYAWVDPKSRRPLTPGRRYRWADAVYMNEQIVVPTDRGVSVFTFSPEYKEDYHEIVPQPGHTQPRVLLDGRGFLAFAPWEGMTYGSDGAWRYIQGNWSQLNSQQSGAAKWPDKLLHVVPLLDGSVLQLYRDQPGGPVKIVMGGLDAATIDEKKIEQLVEQLSADDPEKREAAFNELQRYGVASWPVLERLLDEQSPEARVRMQQLLANRQQPTLGGRKPLDGVMHLADRFTDGGILLYLPGGVSVPQQAPDRPPEIVKPAWVSIRPGRAIELLEPVLTKDAQPGKQHFYAFGDEWLVSDDVQGPRRLAGNHLEPMLDKKEAGFNYVVGFDKRGRWLFKKSPAAAETLVLDPTLPDTTPKLPVWLMWVEKGKVGWSKKDYPVIKRGGAWMLYESGWKPLDEKGGDTMTTQLPRPPITRARAGAGFASSGAGATGGGAVASTQVAGPTTAATTGPAATTRLASSRSATGPAATTQPLGDPILVDADNRRYYDGKKTLHVIDPDGKEIVWPLPPNAVGTSKVWLLRTADGLLFLFNEPGRVVRISRTPDGPEPFKVDAVFTHRVPASDDVQRIWLDPAGRIVEAYNGDRLAIMFPQGRIPRDMLMLIPAKELE